MIFARSLILGLALLAVSYAAHAQSGNLRVGEVQFNGDRATVPIVLGTDSTEGVSAIDFRLKFDPEVFETIDVAAGADAVGKQVMGNDLGNGDYKVVMFGLNQDTVSGGEVAMVSLRVKTPPSGGNATIQLADVTLSLANATDIPSTGGSFPIAFPGAEAPPDDDEGEETPPVTPPPTPNPQQPPPSQPTPAARAPRGTGAQKPAPDAVAKNPPQREDAANTHARKPPTRSDAQARAQEIRDRLPQGGVDPNALGAADAETAPKEPNTNTGALRSTTPKHAAPNTTQRITDADLSGSTPDEEATIADVQESQAPAASSSSNASRQKLRVQVLSAVAAGAALLALLAVRKWMFP